MSAEYIILHDTPHAETQTWEAAVETPTRKLSLALAKPEIAHPDSGFFTPNAIQSFIDQGLKVVIQHGFANHNPFSDADYADTGAEYTQHYADLTMLSQLVLKFDAFTFDQLALSKENQVLFSILPPDNLDQEYINTVNDKKITMICMDYLKDAEGLPMLEKIRKETLSEAGIQISLSNCLFPLVESLIHAPSIAYALQRAPELMPAVFCHAGSLCHQQTAERLHLPWRDVLSLCWNLN